MKVINAFSDNMLNRMVDNYYFRFLWDVSYAYQMHPIEIIVLLYLSRDSFPFKVKTL